MDETLGINDLRNRAGTYLSPFHSVLGLTHAEPMVNVRLQPRQLTDGNGRRCAAPGVTVTIGFNALRVYLARELDNPCRRDIVYRHEMEHVSAWRDHFRAGARLLLPLMQTDLAGPYDIESESDEDEAALRQRVEARLVPLLRRLEDGVAAAQRAIDSPASYQGVENRLRGCPP
ncbi:MAG: hypothetical protein EKK46_10380 [Rhodocyclaceae bacterium]|nr:MAG: hypothetical protein EKK46_10380 [Rhodocyclaceae bacterium]